MHYLTNYYKNLCEDLERKIQNLTDILEDVQRGRGWEKLKKHFGEMSQEKFDETITIEPTLAETAKAAREAWKKEAAERSAQREAEYRRQYEEARRSQGPWTWNGENPTGEQPRAEEPRAEQPRAEQPRAEEPRAEQPRAEEPRAEQPRSGSSNSSQDYSWRNPDPSWSNPDPAYEEEMYRRQWQEDEARRAQERYEEVKRYTDAMRARAEEMRSRSVGAKVSRVVDSLKGMSRSRGGRLAGGAALAVPIAIGVGKVGSMIGDLFANDINPKNPDLNSPGYSNINQYPKLSDIQKDTLFKGMKYSTDMDRIKTYDMVRSAEEREKQRQLEKIEREGTVPDDELIPSLSDDEWLAAHEKYLKRRETQMQVPEPTKERMEPVSPYPFYQRGD